MHVRTDWEVRVTLEQLLAKMAPSGRPPGPRLVRLSEEAIASGAGLIDPKSISGDFEVSRVESGHVSLKSGVVFRSLHLSRLLDGAERVVIDVRTIGPRLEQAVSELENDKDMARAFVLSTYGSIAVGNLGRETYNWLAREFPRSMATVSMAPGQLDWDVSEQALVFQLLSPGKIGITLTNGMMMVPLKSSSSLFGLGDPARVKRGAPACEKCPRRDTCDFKKEAQDIHKAN